MKMSQIAAKLDTTPTTIGNWIKEFDAYFSDGAKERRKSFTQEDLDLLATIAKLSSEGLNYEAIANRLKSNAERENFEDTTLGADNRVIPAAAVEQMIDASELRLELEQIRAERDRLIEENQEQRAELRKLNERVIELERELGRAEGELQYRRQLDEKQ